MAIDIFISTLKWSAIAIDGHRRESIVVGNVYRWTPSPAYFHAYVAL